MLVRHWVLLLGFDGKRTTYDGGEELESGEEQATVLGGARFLDVELGKGHEVTVGETDEEATGVEGADAGGGHHDDVGNAAEEAGSPETVLAAKLGGDDTGETGADEGAEGHERGDELLTGGLDVPANDGVGILVAVDLEEGHHGLETTDEAEIDTILEGGKDHDTAGQEHLPVVLPGLLAYRSHDGQR